MPETSTVEKLKWADHPYIHALSGLRFPKNDKWKGLFRGRSLELFGIFFDDSALDTQGGVDLKMIITSTSLIGSWAGSQRGSSSLIPLPMLISH